MYNIAQIRRVGFIHIVGGVAVVLAGTAVETLAGGATADWFSLLTSNLIGFGLFGGGWYLFNRLVMGQMVNNLKKGLSFANQPMKRLADMPGPPRRFGQDYQVVEAGAMLLAAILVGIVTSFVSNNASSGFSLGGFAGGWLVGGGFGRLRFVDRARAEQRGQEREFYFSDATIGPRTEISFYEAKPGKRTLEEVPPEVKLPKVTSADSLPPGVRRRVGSPNKATGGPVRKRAKATPIVPVPPAAPKAAATSPSPKSQKEQ